MLHHLNEVGDNLCLKFSRRKHNLTHPNLSDETDSQPRCWYDPSHPQFTAVVPNCPCCRGEQGNGALSAHTRGQCLAAAIFYMFGKQCFYNTLICAPFKEKKQLKHLWKHLLAITHMTWLLRNCWITLKLDMHDVKMSTCYFTLNLVHLWPSFSAIT